MASKRPRSFLADVETVLDRAGAYLKHVGTVTKLAQLVPVIVGLLVVFFSPSAWLSGTLRRWAFAGVAVGAWVGIMTLTRVGARQVHKQGFAAVLLAASVSAAAVLRLHLAIADVPFIERWPFLQPLHDLYLGHDLGELAFDVLAAFWFAVLVASATLGLPVYLAWRRERHHAAQTADDESELQKALTTVARGMTDLTASVKRLQDEKRVLEAELESLRGAAEVLPENAEAVDPPTRPPP